METIGSLGSLVTEHEHATIEAKLNALTANKRTTNQAKLVAHYDAIMDAIKRGVSLKVVREALCDAGVNLSPATFKRLLDAETVRRKPTCADVGGTP